MKFLLATAAGVCALVFSASPALAADCAGADAGRFSFGYFPFVLGDDVFACVVDVPNTSFPLLRQEVDSGVVVKMAAACVDPVGLVSDAGFNPQLVVDPIEAAFSIDFVEESGGCCIEDTCVPPGTYHYGLATPIACPNPCLGPSTGGPSSSPF